MAEEFRGEERASLLFGLLEFLEETNLSSEGKKQAYLQLLDFCENLKDPEDREWFLLHTIVSAGNIEQSRVNTLLKNFESTLNRWREPEDIMDADEIQKFRDYVRFYQRLKQKELIWQLTMKLLEIISRMESQPMKVNWLTALIDTTLTLWDKGRSEVLLIGILNSVRDLYDKLKGAFYTLLGVNLICAELPLSSPIFQRIIREVQTIPSKESKLVAIAINLVAMLACGANWEYIKEMKSLLEKEGGKGREIIRSRLPLFEVYALCQENDYAQALASLDKIDEEIVRRDAIFIISNSIARKLTEERESYGKQD